MYNFPAAKKPGVNFPQRQPLRQESGNMSQHMALPLLYEAIFYLDLHRITVQIEPTPHHNTCTVSNKKPFFPPTNRMSLSAPAITSQCTTVNVLCMLSTATASLCLFTLWSRDNNLGSFKKRCISGCV